MGDLGQGRVVVRVSQMGQSLTDEDSSKGVGARQVLKHMGVLFGGRV